MQFSFFMVYNNRQKNKRRILKVTHNSKVELRERSHILSYFCSHRMWKGLCQQILDKCKKAISINDSVHDFGKEIKHHFARVPRKLLQLYTAFLFAGQVMVTILSNSGYVIPFVEKKMATITTHRVSPSNQASNCCCTVYLLYLLLFPNLKMSPARQN